MDKRLPLALLLSFVILFGWSLLVDPPERGEEAQQGAPIEAGTDTPESAEVAERVPELEPIGAVVAEEFERELTLFFGEPGQPGSYRAIFTNRGAALRELRQGDSWDRVGLTAEERLQPEHWTILLSDERLIPGTPGSLTLAATASSKDLVRAGTPLAEALWSMEVLGSEEAPEGVEFTYAPGRGLRYVKRVRFQPGTRDLQVELEFENEGVERKGEISFLLTPAQAMPRESTDNFYQGPEAIAAGRRGPDKPLQVEKIRKDARGKKGALQPEAFDVPATPLSFVGVENKYFTVLLRGADARSNASLRGALWRRVVDATWAGENPGKEAQSWNYLAADAIVQLALPPMGESVAFEYLVYGGPKEPSALQAALPDGGAVVEQDLQSFLPGVSSISKLLLVVLGFFQSLTGNWGVSIILLTVCMRAVLFPLNRRSQTSMARHQNKMKRIQPKLDEIKKRYEKDAQKLRQEQARIMQEEGAFPPLGGCLPIFLQLPVFFGLFLALRTSYDLRQAPFFGWIDDLSMPDRLMRLDLDTHLPLVGTIEYLNVLPPLMVVLWVLQQKLMPKPADEQAARMQRMMLFMPVVMGFFLYNYAAGLSLYMITQSFLGILEVGFIKKKWPVDDTEQPGKKKKQPGFLARLAEQAQQRQRKIEAAKRGPQRGGGSGKGGGSRRSGSGKGRRKKHA